MTAPADSRSHRAQAVHLLYGRRPRRRFARASGALLWLVVAYSWMGGQFHLDEFFSPRRLDNMRRFVRELTPYPLQGRAWDWRVAAAWLGDLMDTKGWAAGATTLAVSVIAIVLAAVAAMVLSLPAARTLAASEPYLPHASAPSRLRRGLWASLRWSTRVLLIFLRSIPEYMWAFLLIAILGPTPWSGALALALHNGGILGKLSAEGVENLEQASLGSLRALGARRRQVVLAGILPAVIGRFLLFFFYRWETCVREATVLGMLGIVSLGYYIHDSRARQHNDEMFVFILLGSLIVVVGDLASAAAREVVRRRC